MNTMNGKQIVEVRFLKGQNKRFFGAREAAKNSGYPDVPTYLRSTGQVSEWCEEIPQKELEQSIIAEEMREITLLKGSLNNEDSSELVTGRTARL